MNIISKVAQFQKLNKLIDQEKTGTPTEFAKKLNVSKTKLYELIDEIRSFGKDIKYSRKEKTFYYEDSSKLDIIFSLKLIEGEEIKNIYGGSKFSLPSFFPNGASLYL